MVAESAGLSPAGVVVPETIRAMAEKDIDISAQYSKPIPLKKVNHFDLIVNLSGFQISDEIEVPMLTWNVPDPIGQSDSVYRRVRDEIEHLVTQLILKFRRVRSRTHRRLV